MFHDQPLTIQSQLINARRVNAGAWIAATLRSSIAAGELAPGAKLSEASLSETFGVSRNTLREAFSALASEHIITQIPNRGVFVARPSVEDAREMYRVRLYLEPAALTWSAALDLTDLRAAVEQAQVARAAGSVSGMAEANQKFHAAVVNLVGSERLNSLMSGILAEMRLVFHVMASHTDFHEHFLDDNVFVVKLLEEGRHRKAATVMTKYLKRAENELLTAMTEHEQDSA